MCKLKLPTGAQSRNSLRNGPNLARDFSNAVDGGSCKSDSLAYNLSSVLEKMKVTDSKKI
jgi:hypothetical protein